MVAKGVYSVVSVWLVQYTVMIVILFPNPTCYTSMPPELQQTPSLAGQTLSGNRLLHVPGRNL